MSRTSRDRLVRLVRRPDADLAEAALLCCAELDPALDVDVALLRVDAIADGLRVRGFRPGDPAGDARALSSYLADEQGFTGDSETYYNPDNALLTRVLDRKRGLPISLSIVYVAIGRRLGVQAYPVDLPGHVVIAIAGNDGPVVLDPFDRGRLLDEPAIAARVEETTAGRVRYHRAMLRPSPAADVVRRLLNNLTRDLTAAQRPRDALGTVELKLLLPNRSPDDHRARGELLLVLGRFDLAAAAFEAYLDDAGPAAPDAERVRRAAVTARAQMN